MKKFFASLILGFAIANAARAVIYTQNLGMGLAYHRIHQLPGDLPVVEGPRRGPCILDVRYVTGNAEDAAALASWLKSHATSRAPVFVLANSATSTALFSAIPRGAGTNIIVFGAVAPEFTPDITLKVSAEAERRAYDAVEHGASAGSVLSENPDKPRNDEAKLARERQSEIVSVTEEPGPPSASFTPESGKSKPPPPIVDPVLQRAVQTHRTLVALKKL